MSARDTCKYAVGDKGCIIMNCPCEVKDQVAATRSAAVQSDGGPSSYYDFLPGWVTFNDFMEHKAVHQWGGFALHLKDIGKALCRFGVKAGTTQGYDARKIVYSGLRLLIMLEGRDAATAELRRLADDPQFQASPASDRPPA